MNLLMFSLTCPLISNALPPMASDGDRFLAKSCPGLKHLKKGSRNTFRKTEPLRPFITIMIFEADEFMRFLVASWRWWGVLVQPTSSLTHGMTRVEPQGAASASWSPVPGQVPITA